MKTILVPTDFSALSKVGLAYAINIAKKTKARIIVITAVTEVTAAPQELSSAKKYQENMLATATSDGGKLLNEFKADTGGIDVSFQAVAGFPVVNVIEEFAVKNSADLIVMSSKGATGLRKIVMGSNATAVIDNSSVPVLVVPAEASPKAIGKVIYATDAKNFRKEVKIATSFAETLGATMEVVHVVASDTKEEKDPLGVSGQKLKVLSALPNIHMHEVHDKDVSKGLETFIASQKEPFILVTFTHRLNFNEKLFGKSVTQQLAYHNSVPMLVVNKSNQSD